MSTAMSKGTILVTALLAAVPALAEPLVEPSSDQRFERSPVLDGKPFLCLGAGIRKKSFWSVYAIDFCVEAAAGRAELARWLSGAGRRHAGKRTEALAQGLGGDPEFFQFMVTMPVEKSADIVFVRDVSREKIREAFTWSLVRALGEAERPRIESFVSLIDRDIKEGERIALRTTPSGEVTLSLGSPHHIKDEKLSRALWQAYLGPDSVTPALKASVALGTALYAAR